MRIRALVRLSSEFQVVESEAEIEVKKDTELIEAFENLQQDLLVATSGGLQRALGQKKALEQKSKNSTLKGLL